MSSDNPFDAVVGQAKNTGNPFDAVFAGKSDNPFDAVFAGRKPSPAPGGVTAPGAVPSSDPLVQTLSQAGFKGDALRTAYAISMRESGGRSGAYNPDRSTGDDSYGLFQINMLGNLGPSRRKQYGLKSNNDLYDAATNARVAFAMSKGGKDFGAWGLGPNAYRSGAGFDTIKKYYDSFPGAGGGRSSYVAPVPSGPKVNGVDKRVIDMASRFGLNVTSGYRSPERQAQLYAGRSAPGSVGAPGKSYHNFGKAVDVSPGPQAYKLAEYARANPHLFKELFFSPLGWYIKHGKIVKGDIGGHSDHLHFAM